MTLDRRAVEGRAQQAVLAQPLLAVECRQRVLAHQVLHELAPCCPGKRGAVVGVERLPDEIGPRNLHDGWRAEKGGAVAVTVTLPAAVGARSDGLDPLLPRGEARPRHRNAILPVDAQRRSRRHLPTADRFWGGPNTSRAFALGVDTAPRPPRAAGA